MDPGFVFEDAFGEEEGAVQDAWEAQEALLDAVSIRPARGRSLDAKIRDQQDQARRRTRGMAMEGGLERGREGRKRSGRRNGKSAGSDGSDSDRPGVDSEEDEGEEVEEEAWEDRLEAATKRKDATKSDRNRDERQEKGLEEADDPSASSSDDERVEEDEQGGGGGDELPSAEGEEQGRTKTKSIREFFDTKAKASFSAKSFHDLHLSRPLLKACVALGYETPTPIQVHGMIMKLGQFTDSRAVLVVGGLNLNTQAAALRGRPDIIVGTPGRVIDHLRNTLSFGLEDLATLVLDEADRLLEMGFSQEVDQIVRMCPKGRQTLLFSATMTEEVRQLEAMSLKNPVRLSADASGLAPKDLTIEVIRIKEKHVGDKEAMLLSIVTRSFKSEVIIFAKTKQQAHRLNLLFGLSGLKASELHGNMTQAQRLEALEKFRNKESSFLIATDVAARGLDIIGVKTVINYDSPRDLTSFLHRVGRTARAGRAGCAITFAENTDKALIKMVQKHTEKKALKKAMSSEAKGSAEKKQAARTKKALAKDKATSKNKGKGEKRERPKSEDDLVAEKAGREAKRIKSYEKQLRQQGLAPSKAMLLARQKAGVGKLHDGKGSKDQGKRASASENEVYEDEWCMVRVEMDRV
eukprot:jgi/Pico_ML_1/54817/g679.t1